MNWRTKTEARLENMGKAITTHPKKIILLLLLISFAIMSNLPKITIDTSTEGFLHHEDPALVRYEKFKEQFGQDEKIMVVVKTKDIFDLKFVQKLQTLHNELKNGVPHLDDITSLINARNTRGENDSLIVEDLFENFPKNEQELEAIKKTALNSEMYSNLLFNDDLTFTTIILEPSAYEGVEGGDDLEGFGEETATQDLEFLKDESKSEMVRATSEIIAKFKADDFDVFIAGSLAVNDYIKQSLQKDIQKFVKLVLQTFVYLFEEIV